MPRFAIVDDPAPNSFGVGTRPKRTIIGVTTGLVEKLSRDELEAVLAYEVSRTGSWDVALSSWTVALTGEAIAARDSDNLVSLVLGWLPQRLAEWLQTWALRGQARERDETAIKFTRNPASLVRALEQLDEDQTQVGRVSRATAPLWVEFPARALGDSSSRATRRAREELLLDERIDHLRELATLGHATRAGPDGRVRAGRRGSDDRLTRGHACGLGAATHPAANRPDLGVPRAVGARLAREQHDVRDTPLRTDGLGAERFDVRTKVDAVAAAAPS